MNHEIIIFNECTNAGKEIYLYDDACVGAMIAYGYSAYVAAKCLRNPLSLFDKEINMPSVVLRQTDVEALKRICSVDEYENRSDYTILHVNEPQEQDMKGYDLWLEHLKALGETSRIAEKVDITTIANQPKSWTSEPSMMGLRKSETFAVIVAMGITIVLLLMILLFRL